MGRPFHLRSQTYGLTPVPNVLWDPPVPPSPLPVTRRGVRGLIICSDPGLPARDGCPGSVALDPIDAAREREGEKKWRGGSGGRGGRRKTDPGSRQSALLGRLMNVQDFMIFATQSQWSQATMTYSLLVRKLVSPPPSSFPGSPPAPRFPTEPELGGLTPLHKHWRSIPAAASLTLSTFQPDCAGSLPAAAHVRRSDRKLARAGPACFTTPLAACDRLPRRLPPP